MTKSEHSARSTALLDTVLEMNEANPTGGSTDLIDLDQSKSSTNKRTRITSVFSSRSQQNEKKATNSLVNSVGQLSVSNSGGTSSGNHSNLGANQSNENSDQSNIVAALSQHTNPMMSVASSGFSTSHGKSSGKNSNSTVSSTTKQFLTQRVRSRSKTDSESVTDKSLFSRFFPKKPKKPLATLLTTTTNSIDLTPQNKRSTLINQTSIASHDYQRTIDEEVEGQEDNDYDDDQIGTISETSLSDPPTEQPSTNSTRKNSTSSRTTGRTNSGSGKYSNTIQIPTSDSQYYASMTSAPKGFSISYHKRISKDNDDLRKQAVLGRFQQQKILTSGGTTTTSTGPSQLMSLFQDPQRTGAQSPPAMSGTTRMKTFSGQTIITRNDSSDGSPTYCIRSSSMSPTQDPEEFFFGNEEIYSQFMKNHSCYDVMPKSSKLVIFDTKLAVKKAFFALVYNGVRAAPLWDTKRQKFIGMLTITDFILILQKYYKEPHAKIEELEEHRIETWREVLKEYEKPLLCIRPNQTLFDAIEILLNNHVHRLPIVDPITNNVVFILTHKRILRFFYLYIYDWPQPSFMSKSLEELNVGTYDNMQIIEEETTIIQALNVFVKYRVSALPVVDKNRKLVNIYSKFDVIGLAADKTYRNLNMTIRDALAFRKERSESVAKCYKHESLSTCMERIVKAEVHRLVVVDNEEHVIGVLSLSDLLNYIIIRPTKISESNSPISSSERSSTT